MARTIRAVSMVVNDCSSSQARWRHHDGVSVIEFGPLLRTLGALELRPHAEPTGTAANSMCPLVVEAA